jgi:DNA-binding response OmpR family regulator
MAWTVLLLSEQFEDIRELLPAFPMGPWHPVAMSLKAHEPKDLIPIHPDVVLIDATGDVGNAEDAARDLSTAWEIGLPPVLAIVDEETVTHFRFDLGTDDFILRSAPAGEISARLEIAARRSGRGDDPLVLKVGDVTVNPENYQVYVRGRPLDLTFKEFELLKFLAQRPGRVCDRDLLLREVWGYDYYGGTRTVDVHIRRLRAKLGAEHEALIETIRNVGYRLVPRPRER